jgi:hypothetical protein
MAEINLSPYTAESEAIARKLRMAELLNQQAMQPIELPQQPGVKVSHLAGLAKMLDAFTAGRSEREARQESKALAEKYQTETSGDFQSLLKALTAPGTAAVPEGAPTYTPDVNPADITDNSRLQIRPERDENNAIIPTGQMGAGSYGVSPGTPAIPARAAGELTPEGFASMRTPMGQQQYMAQLLAQVAPKEGTVLPEGASYISRSGKVLIQGKGKEDWHQPKTEFSPLTGQTLTVAYSNKGNRKVIDTQGAYSPDQWNSIPVADRARLIFDQYKFGNVSANDLLQAGQKNVQLGQELAKLQFETGATAGGGVNLPKNQPMPTIPANGPQNVPLPGAGMGQPAGQPTGQPTGQPMGQGAPARPGYTPLNQMPTARVAPPVAPTAAAPIAPTAATANKPIIDQVTPKERQSLLVAQPKSQAAATTSLQGIDRLVNVAKELSDHPGLERITGKVGQFSSLDFHPQATAARGLQSTLVKQAAVNALQAMREASTTGGAVGSVTEGEWPILEQQLAALNGAQSAKDYKVALTNLQNQLTATSAKIKSAYAMTYGPLKYTAPDYQRQDQDQAPPGAVRRIR